jgi:hypothetical protein
VVVVEVAGTAGVAGVVVVVLVVVVGGGVAQPESADAMTTAAKQAMMSFFIRIIFVWLVTLTARTYAIGWSPAMGCNPTLRQTPDATRFLTESTRGTKNSEPFCQSD